MVLTGPSHFLEQVHLLAAPGQPPRRCDALIEAGALAATGQEARQRAEQLGLPALDAKDWWLGPALVDPHSVLEQPQGGRAETLQSLARSAAAAGYGTVAVLPQARPWRDRPEAMRLPPLAGDQAEARILPWGSFSSGGAGLELAPHREQLDCGAVGLAEAATMPPLALLERGLRLAEMGDRPVLIAPHSEEFSQAGFVREGVEALRLGWPPDPVLSETMPLGSLLALAQGQPQANLRLMNLPVQAPGHGELVAFGGRLRGPRSGGGRLAIAALPGLPRRSRGPHRGPGQRGAHGSRRAAPAPRCRRTAPAPGSTQTGCGRSPLRVAGALAGAGGAAGLGGRRSLAGALLGTSPGAGACHPPAFGW